MTDEEDQIHHIRVSGILKKNHNEIYKKLGVKNPLKRNTKLSEKGCSDQIKNRNPDMTGFLGLLIESWAK